MPQRPNSCSLTCPIRALATIILQLVTKECRKLHMVDWYILTLIFTQYSNLKLPCHFIHLLDLGGGNFHILRYVPFLGVLFLLENKFLGLFCSLL